MKESGGGGEGDGGGGGGGRGVELRAGFTPLPVVPTYENTQLEVRLD